jgi:tetratricopeptide (TPR) repeat protein
MKVGIGIVLVGVAILGSDARAARGPWAAGWWPAGSWADGAPPEAARAEIVRTDRPAPPAVERLETARAQLEHADLLRRALRGVEEPARREARLRAAAAYRAVREHFPGDAAACAEASFRRAELLRQLDALEDARSEYAAARERGVGTPWRVRAALELGHLERRAKRGPEALAAYEAVIADAAAAPGQRDDASLWIGRVLADLGRSADAVRVWTRVADGADDPLDRIRAHDEWARDLVVRGDLEGAAGVLERCREKLADAAQEESRLGERVRNALTGMRAIEELARAVEARRNGRGSG